MVTIQMAAWYVLEKTVGGVMLVVVAVQRF